MKKHSKILSLIVLVSLLAGCTTQKSRSDLSLLGKIYNNTTARYNGYFNANEILKESVVQLNEQHDDNYNKVLDIYKYVSADNPKAVAENLDEAIKKVSVVVSLRRDKSHWIDDCYLLLGKAQYLKQDYEAAEEAFRYLMEEYSPSKMEKRKAVKKKDKKVSKKKKKKGGSSKKEEETKEEKAEEKERAASAKEAEKERKAYNRNVKKNKKNNSAKDRAKEAEKKRKAYNRAVRNKRNNAGKTTVPKKKDPVIANNTTNKNKTTTPGEPIVLEKQDSTQETKISENAASSAEGGGIGIIRLSDGAEEIGKAQKAGFLKHRPAYQEGVLWLARTLIERDNVDGARRYFNQLKRNGNLYKDIQKELAVAEAHLELREKDYRKAVIPLQKAIQLADNRQDKARYTYIIAQILQENGQWQDAYASFQKVLKYGPDYEMEFSSRLNMAQSDWRSGRGTVEAAVKNLRKLLRDDKNEEYKDQIYYAMADIALKSGDREGAIENLSLSLQNSSQNRTQKAESYLLLADLYMEEEEYVSAKYYYDSTLMVLNKTDERFPRIEKVSNSLTDIAANIEIIELQDSLLKISSLSEEEKRALAFEIKKQQDEKRRQQIASRSANTKAGPPSRRSATSRTINGRTTALQKESNFFAYDDRQVKRGKKDFDRKYGGRPLRDDWRRSNVKGITEFDEEEIVEEVPETVLNDEDVNKLLGGIPTTEEEIAKAHLKIKEAMFKLGTLYRERLENNKKSVAILEKLNTRYPASNFELDSWYYLYLAYTDLKQSSKAAFYKNKILNKYGNSTYAKIIMDPDYASKLKDKEFALNQYYDEAYSLFKKGSYQEAFQQSSAAKEKFGAANTLQPKFALLAAMSSGNLQGKDAYVKGLKEVIAKYPDTEEQRRAKEILRLLGGGRASLPGNGEENNSPFKAEDNVLHYIIIAFNKDINLLENKTKVSDYNRKYHKLDKLRISNIYLGTQNRIPIIVIRRFKNKKEAMGYYDGVKKNSGDFIQASTPHQIFAVTQSSYRQILKNKSLEGYQEFFELNYLD